MNAKKLLSLAIILVLLLSSFMACVSGAPSNPSTSESASEIIGDSSIEDSSIPDSSIEQPDDPDPVYPEYGNYPENSPHYSERGYVAPDEEAIAALIEEIKTKGADGVTSYEEVMELREQFYEYYYEALTSRSIAEFEFYRHYSDTELQERSAYISNYTNNLNNQAFEMEQVLFETEHKDALIEELGQDYYEMVMGYNVKDEEILALEETITNLETEYEGTQQIYANFNKFAEIYIGLVNARNALARKTLKSDGVTYYNNYMEYAYENIYGRSYTPEEVSDFRADICELMVPLSTYIYDHYASGYAQDRKITGTVLKELAPIVIKNTIPQMMNSWNYMMEKGLYDFDVTEDKFGVAFVSNMYAYDDGFMFIGDPTSLVSSLNTVLHEFGHFNEIFAAEEEKAMRTDIYNYDLAETHSQAFELISMSNAAAAIMDKYNTKFLKDSYMYNLCLNMAWAALINCAFDEFEYIMFTSDSELLTPTFVAETFSTCVEKYWPHGARLSLYDVSHVYTSPAYCISYAVSMVFASEVWAQSNAVEKYLEVVSYGCENTLEYVCDMTGLPSPLERSSIETVVAKYEDFLYKTFRWKK